MDMPVTSRNHVPTGVPLAELAQDLVSCQVPAGYLVQGLCLDSRQVREGDLFLALPGSRDSGVHHVQEAIAAGAVAVLADAPGAGVTLRGPVPVVTVPELRRHAGTVASRFFGKPADHLLMVGVTGTNGKTSVSHFTAAMFDQARAGSAALIGTLGSGLPGQLDPGLLTTPDVVSLHRTLAGFHARGIATVVMEVSSHALDQQRVGGVTFGHAVFTNLTRDHLDYHGDLESYGEAKSRLFTSPGLKGAVINADDAFGRGLIARVPREVPVFACSLSDGEMDYGRPVAMVRGTVTASAIGELRLALDTPWGRASCQSPLTGRANAENLLAALATACSAGVPMEACITAMAEMSPVPGRMETFRYGDSPTVIVDYAHTPDALEKSLLTLRELGGGDLVCVFGCGGNRDRGKRPQMGAVAARIADRVYVTSDNPRDEQPESIIADVVAGIGEREHVVIIPDRAEAVTEAIASACSTDVVLVAGKGHETYQEIGGRRYPFSDRQLVRTVLEASA